MISRYLFRDDVLIGTGNSTQTFDEVSKKNDLMLVMQDFIVGTENYWSSYRMTQFYNLSWGWFPMCEEETARLRTLLLLQQ